MLQADCCQWGWSSWKAGSRHQDVWPLHLSSSPGWVPGATLLLLARGRARYPKAPAPQSPATSRTPCPLSATRPRELGRHRSQRHLDHQGLLRTPRAQRRRNPRSPSFTSAMKRLGKKLVSRKIRLFSPKASDTFLKIEMFRLIIFFKSWEEGAAGNFLFYFFSFLSFFVCF